MTADVLQLPGTRPTVERPGLNLTPEEVVEASGGYVRPADQLRSLHARGFVRAWRRPGGPVILERAHRDAVVCGKFGQQQAAAEPPAPQPKPNRAALQRRFQRGG